MSVDRRYRIQCTLGRGGFGRTYLASDEQRFNELCVLKEFVPNSQADPVVAQKLHELFQREAAILHKLDHPQIPKFFAGFEEEERLFIAQEYIDGKTYWRLLQEKQRQGQTFSQREIVEWLRDLLKVLDYLHQQNIVHRDISPDNIMLPKGQKTPVLIDFGVVKQLLPHLHMVNSNDADDLIQASVSVGKFGYAPHEQIRLGQCSPRSDLYALAVTAVVLMTGKPPNLLIEPKSLEWQWRRWLRLDSRLSSILEIMMADRPQDRFASAKAVLQALQPLWEALDSLEAESTVVPASSRKSNRAIPSHSAISAAPLLRADSDWPYQMTAVTDQPVETQIDPEAVTPISPLDVDQELCQSVSTHLEATLASGQPLPGNWSASAMEILAPRSLPLRHRLAAIRAAILQIPFDRLGNSRQLQRLSIRRVMVLGLLALLPLGGAAVGARSPYMSSLCWALENCANDRELEGRYRQAIEQADSAGVLTSHARTLEDLESARKRLTDSIAQLTAFSGTPKDRTTAHAALLKYQTLLKTLDQQLEKETRAVHLLNRAEAEAQKAAEQSKIAKTAFYYQAAQLQWRRALATLAAIPDEAFVNSRVAARTQEYQARLEAINLKLAAATPKPRAANKLAESTWVSTDRRPTAPQPQPSSVAAAAPAPAQQRPAPRSTGAASRQPQRSSPANPTRPAASAQPLTAPQPSTSPLEVDRHWVAGSVVTSATQTLNNVSIWIDGTRTEADGRFVANLWIQNSSGRGFGFVPLYAESKDSSGNMIRSRVLFTSNAGTSMMLEPGKSLMGQIYLIDRPASTQRLTLIIRESTNGDRAFRIPF